uniref:TBC1 domain family member 21 n=1 Tax=Sphenodon punctatus TaxID=8508 RepID=A0A8D0GVH8_SPHPU
MSVSRPCPVVSGNFDHGWDRRHVCCAAPIHDLSARFPAVGIKKLPIDKSEWESYFDESGHLTKSRDFVSSNILERGLDPSVRSEAWKFLTGYYLWRSSHDERLAVDGKRRRNYEALCSMYDKIQPLLETQNRDFMEIRSFIKSDLSTLCIKDPQGIAIVDKEKLEKILLLSYVCNVEAEYQQGFHEMLLLFQLLVEKEHEIFWLFQFFLQKTEHSCVINIGVEKNLIMLKAVIAFMDPVFAKHLEGKGNQVVPSLFPWFCLFFQQVFKTIDDIWRLWEVFLTGLPCRNFQVIVAYTMLQMVRDDILKENMSGDDILLVRLVLELESLRIIPTAVKAHLLQKGVNLEAGKWVLMGRGK